MGANMKNGVFSIRRLKLSEHGFDYETWQLVGHLQSFLAARKLQDAKPVAERVYAPFSPPPKPTQTEGLMTVMSAVRNMSMDAEFRAGMQRTFVNCCQAPDPDRMARGLSGVEQFRPYPVSHADMKKLSDGCGRLPC